MNNPTATETARPSAPACALAVALALLPWLLMVPATDSDRLVPLAFLPALWLLWASPHPAVSRCLLLLSGWVLVAMVVAAATSTHTARSLVMSAAVSCALMGACVAQAQTPSPTSVRLILYGLLLGAVSGGVMVWLGWGAERTFFPVYWSARLFGGHMLSGALAGIALLAQPAGSLAIRIATAALTLTCWTCLAWSGSRAPALALAITLIVWFSRGGPSIRHFSLKWVPALGLLALLCSRPLGTPYPQMGWWHAMERTSHATSVMEITSERTEYWGGVWEQIQRSPWIGNGADAYLFLVPKQPGNQPHNTYLQWLLEYGIFGFAPLLALAALTLTPLCRKPPEHPSHLSATTQWAAASMAGLAAYALFDGVGYHMVVFMPAAVIAGLALGGANISPEPAIPARSPSYPVRLLPLTAMGLLLLHGWLILLLIRGRNITPESAPARILRIFPSSTYCLANWTEAWRPARPEVASEWIEWAQRVSDNPGSFHVHAAQVYIREKNWHAAEIELLECLQKVNVAERADVQIAIDTVRMHASKQNHPSAVNNSHP